MRHETKKAAELEAFEKTKEAHWFCPLINGDCNHDCLCFKNAYVRKHSDEYSVYEAFCDNAMFSGIIYNQTVGI